MALTKTCSTKNVMLVLTGALLLSGCATNSNQPVIDIKSYKPVVDTKGADMTKYDQDLAECRELAQQVTVGGDTATGALIGAGLGAAIGAAAGAISGDPGMGAAIGASTGGIGGGATGYGGGIQRQITIINNCLSGRGYKVLG